MNRKNHGRSHSYSILREALAESQQRELAALPLEESLKSTYEFSEFFLARVRRLFAYEKRRDALLKAARLARRTAVAFVVALVILFAAVIISPKVRAAVKEVIIKWFEQYTSFQFWSNGEKISNLHTPNLRYLPKGFSEIDKVYAHDITTVIYENQEKQKIVFSYAAIENGRVISADNEKSTYTIISVQGVQAYLFVAQQGISRSKLIWEKDQIIYRLEADLDSNELIEIAQKIIP